MIPSGLSANFGQRGPTRERAEQHAHAEGARKDADEERVCALQGVVVDEGERNVHQVIMGERNSYSKTDHDATFMRMKVDPYA